MICSLFCFKALHLLIKGQQRQTLIHNLQFTIHNYFNSVIFLVSVCPLP